MRRNIQIISFFAFLLLFFLATYPLQQLVPVDLFFRIDPLIAITAMLASRTIIAVMFWSLLLVGFAVFYGRAFCGYVCPLGSTIDFIDHFVWSKRKKRGKKRIRPATPSFVKIESLRKFKYYVLVFVVVSALFGVMTIHFFDPFSVITRAFTVILYPAVMVGVNFSLDLIRPLAEQFNWFTLSRLSFIQHSYYMSFVTLLLFVGILALGRLQPRFWCRNVCPLGAMLGLLGRFSLVKRKVNDACIDCGICARECPFAAVQENARETLAFECIHCRHCRVVCPKEVVTFETQWLPKKESAETLQPAPALDLSRRGFMVSAGTGIASAFLLGIHPSKKLLEGGLIRPPGTVPEEMFLDRCIRCGECMKACMTNTLQPSFFESGIEGLWTPRLDLRYAPCEQRCNVCGQVCPTDAIRDLDLEERKHAKIGTAVLVRDRCLVWEQDKNCLICDEQCPYDAIEFRAVEGFRRPFVIEDRCNGCGVCENKCPVQGQAAIVVTPIAAMRLADGSYIEEAERLGYEFDEARDESDQFFFDEQTNDPDLQQELPPGFSTEQEQELPPGFVQ